MIIIEIKVYQEESFTVTERLSISEDQLKQIEAQLDSLGYRYTSRARMLEFKRLVMKNTTKDIYKKKSA